MNISSIWPDIKSELVAPVDLPSVKPRIRHVPGYLLLPFGRAVKSDLQKIGLAAVSPDGLYLSTDVPTIFICKSDRKPVCLSDFDKHFGEIPDDIPYDDDVAILNYICTTIKSHNPNMTLYEELFLDLYFETLKALTLETHPNEFKQFKQACARIGRDWMTLKSHKKPNDVWRALLPVPEMQTYVRDPLSPTKSAQPDNNFRVDYGFWDGDQLIAVEIDGAEPSGYARDVRRDRLLRNAKIEPIHILNVELARHRGRALQELLPAKFFGHGWKFEGERPTVIPF